MFNKHGGWIWCFSNRSSWSPVGDAEPWRMWHSSVLDLHDSHLCTAGGWGGGQWGCPWRRLSLGCEPSEPRKGEAQGRSPKAIRDGSESQSMRQTQEDRATCLSRQSRAAPDTDLRKRLGRHREAGNSVQGPLPLLPALVVAEVMMEWSLQSPQRALAPAGRKHGLTTPDLTVVSEHP